MNLDYSEVFCADDTILFGTKAYELEKILQNIEEVSSEYGLRLNQKKCEHIHINSNKRIRFKSGREMPAVGSATY